MNSTKTVSTPMMLIATAFTPYVHYCEYDDRDEEERDSFVRDA